MRIFALYLLGLVAAAAVAMAVGACREGVGPDGPEVGAACEEALDCAAGSVCLLDPEDFPSGMCSTPCKSQDECPEGSACVAVGNGQCVLGCAAGAGCREGLRCKGKRNQSGSGESEVCISDDDP